VVSAVKIALPLDNMADNTSYTRNEEIIRLGKNMPRDKLCKFGNCDDNKDRETPSKLWHTKVN
jgi:hypothetical protein